MAQAPVASQVHQTFDIHGDFGPELTFDFAIIIYHFADTVDLHFRQIIGIRIQAISTRFRFGKSTPEILAKPQSSSILAFVYDVCFHR
jgi:hypothetical protein